MSDEGQHWGVFQTQGKLESIEWGVANVLGFCAPSKLERHRGGKIRGNHSEFSGPTTLLEQGPPRAQDRVQRAQELQ